MSITFPKKLLALGPLAFLLACTDSRDLPSAPDPSIAANRSAMHQLEAPSPRGYPLMAHDPVRDQVYLVGGFYGSGFDAEIFDVWRFNPRSRTWKQLADVLPPKNGDAAALDVQSRKIIEYQPYVDPVETWAYDIETGVWENRHPAVEPPPRWGSIMVYDRESDRILLYGGTDWFDGTTVLGDLWAYDYESNTWTERHPPVSPPPHHFPLMVYVPTIDRVILFGGYQQGFTTLFNDTWAYDYNRNRWKNLKPANPPAPRVYHYMAFEPTTNRIVTYGGVLDESEWPNSPETPTDETWVYSVARNAWSQAFSSTTPSPRAWHVMSGTNGPLLLFGGGTSRDTYTNDTYLYSSRPNRWEQVSGDHHNDEARTVAGVGTASSSQLFRGGRPNRH
jgi:N-acetylneuraminic acid mutarotase